MKILRKPGNSGQDNGLLQVLIIVVVSFAVYLNALPNGFIYDDHSQILKNSLIRDISNIPEIFRRSAWTFEGAPPISNYYRPMLNLFYMFTYHISNLQAWGYHLVNVLFHVGNTVLVFLLASVLLGRSQAEPVKSGGARPPNNLLSSAPFIAALLFATHPIHTEAVTWIGGLSDVSFAFFYLLSFYLYVHSRESYRWQYVFSIISFLLSTLCKEPGLTLPIVLIAYDYAFGTKPPWSFARAKRYAPYFLAAAFYFTVRYHVLGGFAPLVHVGKMSSSGYVINVFPLFSQYLWKLLLPVQLNFWPVFRPIASLFTGEWLLSFCVAVIFICGIVLALKKNRVAFLSLLFIVVPLAPALYLKGVIGKPFADRYLYLPSFGFVMLMAVLFVWARARRPQAIFKFAAILLLISGVYSLGTLSRNSVWKDEYTLFADTATKSPDSVVPRMELGNALLAKGRFDEAIEQYQAAMRIEPDLYVLHHHIGMALAGKNRLYEAIGQYQIAAKLNPYSPDIRVDMGRTYAKSGFLDEAIEQFRVAVELQPNAFNHNLLGIAFWQKGLRDKAIEQFKTANYLAPSEPGYRRNLDEAIAMEKSWDQHIDRTPDFAGKYEEGSGEASDIIKFAW